MLLFLKMKAIILDKSDITLTSLIDEVAYYMRNIILMQETIRDYYDNVIVSS